MCQRVKLGQYKYAYISATKRFVLVQTRADNPYLNKASHFPRVKLKVNSFQKVNTCRNNYSVCSDLLRGSLVFHYCFVNVVETLNNLHVFGSQLLHVGYQANERFHRLHNTSLHVQLQ